MKPFLRLAIVVAGVAGMLFMLPRANGDRVLAAGRPDVTLNVQNATPRQVEDTTEEGDRARLRGCMAGAGETRSSRTGLICWLPISWEPPTRSLNRRSAEQRKSGLHQRYIDKGHNVNAVFYSPEGSAMELQDTAALQIQVLDGDKVLHSEDVTVHYVALLTAAENSWKVRVLEAVPAF